MPSDCDAIQGRLTDAFFARESPSDDDLAHIGTCEACTFHNLDLRAFAAAFERAAVPELAPAVLETTQRRAREALSQPVEAAATLPPRAAVRSPHTERALPVGYRRELVRLVAGSLAPLPLVLLWNAAILFAADWLLASLLPAPVLAALAAAYGVALTSWLAVVYGSLPIVAYRRTLRQQRG